MTIRNDATRIRIVTKDTRRPRAVVSRQGQVLLDTDFDQESRHQLDRIEIETLDSLGSPGKLVVPAGNTGFLVSPDGALPNFNIGAGRGYLNGWLLENPTICKLATQPHPRTGDTVAVPAIIGIKALVRFVDPVEDPVLADVALGDAQSSGRSLVDWQVFPMSVGATVTCATAATNPDWLNLIAPSTGTLTVTPAVAPPSTDPCSLTPSGGYTRLENLLYRIEVHGGDPKSGFPVVDGPRFNLHNLKLKVSRRNASTMARITNISAAEITVTPPALDTRNWFAPGLYAEIVSIHDDVDPRAALANERLFPVALATDDRITLQATALQITQTGAAADGTWFLRLWDAFADGTGVVTVSAPSPATESAVIDLGDGLTIKLAGGTTAIFRRGDYWTCAARADGSIDWPQSGGVYQPMTPHGPEIRYAPIAALQNTASPFFEDCRIPFATLTDRALLYRGGDGQGVFAPSASGMVTLPATLRVAVMRGETPVVGATVRWSFVAPAGGSCQIDGALCNAATPREKVSDANGLVEVTWAIDSSKPLEVHKVQAAIATGPATTSQPPVIFTATFETAAHTGYTPGKCKHLTSTNNVQDAIDTLCSKIDDPEPPTLLLLSILLLDVNAPPTELIQDAFILNALEVPHTAFTRGIAFGFSKGPLDIDIAPFDPVAEIELDLPYPMTDPDRLYWGTVSAPPASGITAAFGFQRVRLDGTIKRTDQGPLGGPPGLLWTPSEQTRRFLETVPRHRFGLRISPAFKAPLDNIGWNPEPQIERVLCRIRLRSAMIWVKDGTAPGGQMYLNAEHLGVVGPTTKRELLLKERDPQRAADLDIFIYLKMG